MHTVQIGLYNYTVVARLTVIFFLNRIVKNGRLEQLILSAVVQ